MVKKNIFIFTVLVIIFFVSCKKKDDISPSRIINIDNTIALYDILKLNDSTILACGGKRNTTGKIYLSENSGVAPELGTSCFSD